MNHEKLTGKSILGVAAVLLLAGQASAKEEAWSEIDAEIRSLYEFRNAPSPAPSNSSRSQTVLPKCH